MKSFKTFVKEGRCWPGHKPVPGKKPYSPGSCVKEELDEAVNEKQIKKDLDAGMSHDAVIGKHANKKVSNTAEIRKVIQKHAWDKRMKKEETELDEETPAWQRKEGKNPEGGLNQKGVESYRRENPGSKLQTAVTTKPSKLKPGSKSAKRRLSFCRRMKGMKEKLTSAETARDPDSRINKSLRKWNC